MTTLIKLNDLLTQPKFRALTEKELAWTILHRLNVSDYNKLEGKYSFDKAKILYKEWHRK